jgi:hypothetical protein
MLLALAAALERKTATIEACPRTAQARRWASPPASAGGMQDAAPSAAVDKRVELSFCSAAEELVVALKLLHFRQSIPKLKPK